MLESDAAPVRAHRLRPAVAAGPRTLDRHLTASRGAALQAASRAAKQAFDRVLAALLLLTALPILAAACLLVLLGDRSGPVLYRQTRVGRDGVEFGMWKLRTMRAATPERCAAANAPHKPRHDPRVTAPGRWLRRFSVDELPQLINVLTGSMSLVGPRPHLPEEADRFDEDARARLLVRPGMTGLWQVSGRSELPWSEQLRLDLHYVEHWSLRLDLGILLRTAGAVLGGRGAY